MIGSVWTAVIAAAGMGCLLAWLYGVYHSVALLIIRWQAAPSRRAAVKQIFWSPRNDGTAGALPDRQRVHRTGSRRGMALFLGFWLIGLAAAAMDVWSAGRHATPAKEHEAAK